MDGFWSWVPAKFSHTLVLLLVNCFDPKWCSWSYFLLPGLAPGHMFRSLVLLPVNCFFWEREQFTMEIDGFRSSLAVKYFAVRSRSKSNDFTGYGSSSQWK